MKVTKGGVFVGIGVLLLAGKWVRVPANPFPIALPVPVMPRPNGYDYFVRAGQAETGYKEVAQALGEQLPGLPRYNIAPSPIDATALLARNAQALRLAHEGLGYACLHPAERDPSSSHAQDETVPQRHVARLLVLEGAVKANHGDWFAAANSYLDAIQMGENEEHGGDLVICLAGIVYEDIGRESLWETFDHLDAAQARAVADRLQAIIDGDPDYSAAMTQQKWADLAGLRKASPPTEPLFVFVVFNNGVRERNYLAFMDQFAAQGKLPYAQRNQSPPLPHDLLNRKTLPIMVPVYQGAAYNFARRDCANALLLTAAALRAYKAEHQLYPPSLDQLIPAYLKSVPPDPFGTGPLKYRLSGGSYLLYSIGPDGLDDGGKPIENPAKSGHARYVVWKENKGDIVAGLNR